MEFQILGPLRITHGGEDIALAGAKQRGLVAILALNAGRVVPAERLLNDLWGDEAPGKNALQARVSQVRKAFEAGGARRVLVGRGSGYVLTVEERGVDAARFETLAAEGHALLELGEYDAAVDHLTRALELWAGPPLTDFADQHWARGDIERLEEMRRVAITERIEAELRRGRHDEAIPQLEKLVVEEPLDERFRAQLMRALYRAGREADALQVFRDARLAAPPAAPVERSNLPITPTGFFGRDPDLDRVPGLLAASRLLTLTGPRGVGRTRLAVEAARRMAPEVPDGCYFVDLSMVTDPKAIPEAISIALGIIEGGSIIGHRTIGEPDPTDLDRRLVSYLSSRDLILILDDCGHLIAPTAKIVASILYQSPKTKIIATAGEPLQVASEAWWQVSSLSLPVKGQRSSIEDLLRYGAIRLFDDRARRADPTWELDDENVAEVVEICIGLDGLPLAIEVVAAHVGSSPLRDLANRVADRLAPLGADLSGVARREKVLRAAVEWAWRRLSAEERSFLSRASAFPGGFTIEAASPVCAPDGDAVSIIERLVQRSLLVEEQHPSGTRYGMLGTIREYAAGELAGSEEEADAIERHVAYFVRLAEAGDVRLRGREQGLWLDLMDSEYENFKVALDRAERFKDVRPALRLAGALGRFWWIRGYSSEARRRLGRLLDDRRDQPTALRGKCLLARAYPGIDEPGDLRLIEWCKEAEGIYQILADRVGQAHAKILRRLNEFASREMAADVEVGRALEGLRVEGDDWGVAFGLLVRASLRAAAGAIDEAEPDTWESLSLFTQVGDRRAAAEVLNLLGFLAERKGDYQQALILTEEGLALAEGSAAREHLAELFARRGHLVAQLGDPEAGLVDLDRAVVLAKEISFDAAVAFARNRAGMAARRLDDLDRAAAFHSEARGIYERKADPAGATLAVSSLAFIAEIKNEPDLARKLGSRALELARATRDPIAVAHAFEALAGAATVARDPERAGILLGAAGVLRSRPNAARSEQEALDVERITAAAMAASPERFERGSSLGETKPLDLVLPYAEFRTSVVPRPEAAGTS